MSKIFISHSSVDNAAALAVAQWLDREGWAGQYFLDLTPDSLAPGERWEIALRAAVFLEPVAGTRIGLRRDEAYASRSRQYDEYGQSSSRSTNPCFTGLNQHYRRCTSKSRAWGCERLRRHGSARSALKILRWTVFRARLTPKPLLPRP